MSRMRSVSVISSSSWLAGTPAFSMVEMSRWMKPFCSNSVDEMLMAIRAFTGIGSLAVPTRNVLGHGADHHVGIDEIAPVASAVGMNTAGDIGPCSGWCQRSRASAAAMFPVRRSMMGW